MVRIKTNSRQEFNSFKVKQTNFWNQLETQQIAKNQVEEQLCSSLGTPTNLTQQNLLAEIVKKINSYYFATEIQNTTIFSLIGTITKASDIIEKQFKEGKNRGQTYYNLKISTEEREEQLQARQEDMSAEKWNQVRKLAILKQKLVFKYKKYITNKQLLDFYPVPNNSPKTSKIITVKPKALKEKISSQKAETG